MLLTLKINCCPINRRMGRIDISSPTQSEKTQAHDNQPMKMSRNISYFFFNKLSKLLVDNSKTLS